MASMHLLRVGRCRGGSLSVSLRPTGVPAVGASQVDGSSHFELLGRALAGSLLKPVPVDVRDEAVDLHREHAVPLGDHFQLVFFGDDFEDVFELLDENPRGADI